MKLCHFLYGKSRSTVDFRTLVKSSNITESDLKYWVLKIGALMQELREVGMPGEDFMRLFIPRQNKDREGAASEWAYVRARTGGDRSRFDYQAVILGEENLDRLFWQPWALDRELFDGNTRDPRVRETLGEGGEQRTGREHHPAVIDIEFNNTAWRPQLSAEDKIAVERLVSSIGNQNAPDARWYLDEGQVGREGARRIIASLLNRLHALDRPIPGFIMGLASVRENNSPLSSSHRSQARLPDILLASYKKESDDYSFPFENWRDATPEQKGAPVSVEDTHGRYDDHSAQSDGLHAQGRATAATAGGGEAAGGADTPPSSSQSGRMRAARGSQESEATLAERPEASLDDETHISAYPDALLGESENLRAEDSYQPHSFDNPFSAATSDTGRRRQSTDASQPPASRPKRAPSAKGASTADGNFFGQVRSHLERPLPLQLALLVALLLLAALGTYAYTNDRKHRTEIGKKENEIATLRAEYDTYKKEQESKPANAVALPISTETPIDSPPPPERISEKELTALRERMAGYTNDNNEKSDPANGNLVERLAKEKEENKKLRKLVIDANAALDKVVKGGEETKRFYENRLRNAREELKAAKADVANVASLKKQNEELLQQLEISKGEVKRLTDQPASVPKIQPTVDRTEENKFRQLWESEKTDTKRLGDLLEQEKRAVANLTQQLQARGSSAEAQLSRWRAGIRAFCSKNGDGCKKLQELGVDAR